jgi:hypothetical protein
MDVIAHDRDRVLPRVIISLTFPDAVRRVYPISLGPDLKISQSLSQSSATYFQPSTSRRNVRVA